MKALILSGGMGKRLRSLLKDLPKPMAPVGGRPFVEYLILHLTRYGVREVVLATGYRKEKIKEYFMDNMNLGVELRYSEEIHPLGTGGAVKKAIGIMGEGDFICMNGDSFLDVDIKRLVRYHRERKALATMALVEVEDAGRYGRVEIDGQGRVRCFVEKGAGGRGLINGGVYVFDSTIGGYISEGETSLEIDVLPLLAEEGLLYGMEVKGFFVDIGTPEAYRAICEDPFPIQRILGRV